jgi:hypothetical protein
MFGITSETRVFLRTGVTDGRLGVEALRGLVSTVLHDLHFAHRLTHFRVITADDGGFLAILALAS